MVDDADSEWRTEIARTYTPAGSDRERAYRTYRHESGDVRLRIAPASLDGEERPGYTIRAIIYPDLEFSETVEIRRVLAFDRCERIARRFMSLFTAVYDGPDALEDALEYATARTVPSSADDVLIDRGEE